jgi:hypothetical protein
VGILLWTALAGNPRYLAARGPSSPYQRLRALAARIKPEVHPTDRLLILDSRRYSEGEKVTVFYELWLPCVEGGAIGRWNERLATRRYRLVLATDAGAREWLRTWPGARLLGAEEPFAFFAIGSE